MKDFFKGLLAGLVIVLVGLGFLLLIGALTSNMTANITNILKG